MRQEVGVHLLNGHSVVGILEEDAVELVVGRRVLEDRRQPVGDGEYEGVGDVFVP